MFFIIKTLAKEFEGELNSLGEKSKKCNTFSVPIKNEVKRIDKNGVKITKTISHKSQFIDGATFVASSLSNLIVNLAVPIYEIKFKYGHDNKKYETFGIKYKDYEYRNVKDDLKEYSDENGAFSEKTHI